MKTNMLDYVKTILSKVSFDKRLFRKEYRKSLNWLSESEASQLKRWLRSQGLVVVRQSSRGDSPGN